MQLICSKYYPRQWRNNLEQERIPVLRFNRNKGWVAYDRKRTVSQTNKQHLNRVVGETHQMECNPHGVMIYSIMFTAFSLILRTEPKVFK